MFPAFELLGKSYTDMELGKRSSLTQKPPPVLSRNYQEYADRFEDFEELLGWHGLDEASDSNEIAELFGDVPSNFRFSRMRESDDEKDSASVPVRTFWNPTFEEDFAHDTFIELPSIWHVDPLLQRIFVESVNRVPESRLASEGLDLADRADWRKIVALNFEATSYLDNSEDGLCAEAIVAVIDKVTTRSSASDRSMAPATSR
jgi:hypothetical protein